MVDLVVVGVTKCGSTYLDSILRYNSSFSLPYGVKETNFFSLEYRRGISWYLGLFNQSKICVEVCPNYARDIVSLRRIKASFPNACILLLLREPRKRFMSHCLHFFRTRNVPASCAFMVNNFPEISLDTDYVTLHNNCVEVFGEKGFVVLRFEDFISDFSVIERYFNEKFKIKLVRPDNIELNEYYDTRLKHMYSFLRYVNRFSSLRGVNLKSLFGAGIIKFVFRKSKSSSVLVNDLPDEFGFFLDQQTIFYDQMDR